MTNRKRLTLELALADLRHEWVLTLCMVLALAAVIAPLMLLMGLKYGTVQTLRDRLVQDPRFREIKPAQTREYPKDWFRTMVGRPEISFLTPTVLPASSIISVKDPSGGHKLWDLVPTGDGDPLLLENGGTIPGPHECVLSRSAAETLGVNLMGYKTLAFAISAFYAGIGGGLYAFVLRFIEPEIFTLLMSIMFLAMVVVGGLGSIMGAITGACLLSWLDLQLRVQRFGAGPAVVTKVITALVAHPPKNRDHHPFPPAAIVGFVLTLASYAGCYRVTLVQDLSQCLPPDFLQYLPHTLFNLANSYTVLLHLHHHQVA